MTPEDIQTQQFHVRFRGFDVEEVDSFLETVAESYLALQEENKTLNARMEELTKEMASYHNQEKTFQKAIMSAQNIAEEMKEKSRQEAEELLSSARKEAEELREDANNEVVGLEKEVDRLRDLKGQVQTDLRDLLESYLDQLETDAKSASSFGRTMPPPDDDLSDLYEKIDLPDNLLNAEPPEDVPPEEEEEVELAESQDEDEPQSTMPDLDGDIIFDLEDPLDEDEPSVSFEEEEKPSDQE